MSRLGTAFLSTSLSLALFGLGRFLFNVLGLRVFGVETIGQLNVSISAWTLIAVVVATVPSFVVSKYASQFLASLQAARAARILGACLCIIWCLSALIAVGSMASSPRSVSTVWPIYGVAYATYLVIRAAYLSHQQTRAMLASEVLGFCVFASLLGAGLVTANVMLASVSLAAQPAVYCIKGLWDFRASIRLDGAFDEFRANLRDFGVFSAATLANAFTGMASYHLSIVLAGKLVKQPADVGFLSVLLSTISPINLVPHALGSVLFAEFARRHGAKDERGPRLVALRATILIQLFVLTLVGSLMAFPELVLQRVGVSTSPRVLVTWTWLVYALGLTIASSPCGHLLNATTHASKQAIASLSFLVVGVAFGIWCMPQFGIVAAGWMRFGVDGGLAWTRMLIAQRVEPWVDRRWTELVLFQLCFGALFIETVALSARWIRGLTLVAGLLVLAAFARSELTQIYIGVDWKSRLR